MTGARKRELHRSVVDMFYHGYDNYMRVFPEDEVRPVSCKPMTRDTQDPLNFVANDPLGNYSLTLIDSLSTLAVLAASSDAAIATKARRDFQGGLKALIGQYGNGCDSTTGLRARGFDVDSTVSVFETIIRGVGGLLSAHLFASGELPMQYGSEHQTSAGAPPSWGFDFVYKDQLLHLALDLARRLLPAFATDTGIPLPRVNLRHGVRLYTYDATPGYDTEHGETTIDSTSTCSAAAGSTLLEFMTLSRLSGDARFEAVARRAFWAIWDRRSHLDLLGADIDALTGQWEGHFTGIGAGIDSFFEYAYKSSILSSGLEILDDGRLSKALETSPADHFFEARSFHDEDVYSGNDTDSYHVHDARKSTSDDFLAVWVASHAAIKRNLLSSVQHPHYVLGNMHTGSVQALWVDALGAFYPGLLSMAGHSEEAIQLHLLYTALWTRYSALPERWSLVTGDIEGGLGWWLGRPEFVESTYHLYRSTRDPWYLHVGEMVIQDIRQRCFAPCGWSGLQDVRTGELNDRMESFFLGETLKYLALLFEDEHPLNSLDGAWVFSTEGHPLIIPRTRPASAAQARATHASANQLHRMVCPNRPAHGTFLHSAVAARGDIFHASNLVGLNLVPPAPEIMPDECTYFYPWTLPQQLIPANGTCALLPQRTTFVVEFPRIQHPGLPNEILLGGMGAFTRTDYGIKLVSLSGLRLALVKETSFASSDSENEATWRVFAVGNIGLGRDEKLLVPREIIGNLVDRAFSRVRDGTMVDLILQMEDMHEMTTTHAWSPAKLSTARVDPDSTSTATAAAAGGRDGNPELELKNADMANNEDAQVLAPDHSHDTVDPRYKFERLEAACATGIGATIVNFGTEAPDPATSRPSTNLTWANIFFAGQACGQRLPSTAVRDYNLIVMERGGCSFSQKLANIPAFTPTTNGLQLVVIVSGMASEEPGSGKEDPSLLRPLLNELQRSPGGFIRVTPVNVVMVAGGKATLKRLQEAKRVGVRHYYHIETTGLRVENIIVT